ncbi:MAG: ribosomal protein [Rhodospirillales bacterium]|jgi:small subunit ribosomal protein S6|nr:ribosomal protein [Rhodospirillales bacterium]
MALYETVFIARQDISSAQAETLAETYSQMIAENGGQVTKTEHWGLKTLAFRMNKNRKGHYVLFNIDAPSAAVLEMERNMRINEDVLRYMSIRVDALEEGPSAMMQNRGGDRSDRGGERGDRGGDRGGMGRGPRPPRRDDRDDRTDAAPIGLGDSE